MSQAEPVVPTKEQVEAILEIVCDIDGYVKGGQYSGYDLTKVSRALAYLESFKATLAAQVKQAELAEKAPVVVNAAVKKAGRKHATH